MKRRALGRAAAGIVVILALVALASPGPVHAQGTTKIARVGTFGTGVSPDSLEAFRQGLHGFGYVEGRNIVIEQAAKALGLTLPQSILVRADEVIQ